MTDEDDPQKVEVSTPLGERLARLEGEFTAEDRILERSLEGVKHGQNLLIGIAAVAAALAIAILVYILTRMDSISAEIQQAPVPVHAK